MNRRLFVQVYITFLAIIVLFGLLTTLAWWLLRDHRPASELHRGMGALLVEALPLTEAPRADMDASLARLAREFDAHITMLGPDGRVLGSSGPDPSTVPSTVRRSRSLAVPLPDGRTIEVRWTRRGIAGAGFLAALGLLALAAAIGAWPLARHLARRLERLKSRVEALGSGDLSARVDVEGRDEIAALAQSFNRAAGRIQDLVDAQRNTLAAASHELRSPLARIRMAVALLADNADPELIARIERDIEELDELIDEILLTSRLDIEAWPTHLEAVDLRALVAEEAARAGSTFRGEEAIVEAEGHLVRHLVRNLLGNARRHAAGSPVCVEVKAVSGRAILGVADRGDGVSEADRERIFEPFYTRPAGREGAGRGSGLGLFLVRRIARRYGGEAVCLQRPGGGALFEVSLPIRQANGAGSVSSAVGQ